TSHPWRDCAYRCSPLQSWHRRGVHHRAGAAGMRGSSAQSWRLLLRTLRKNGGHTLRITEGQTLAGHFLPGLMALAGHQHGIARLRFQDGLADGGGTVALHHGGYTAQAGADGFDDHGAILVARIVIGEDDAVRQTRGY